MRHAILYLALLVFLTGCSVSKRNSRSGSEAGITKNQLLFITLEVNKMGSGLEFKVKEKKVVDGKLKIPMPESLDLPDYLICDFTTSKNRLITRVAVENPLYRIVEAPNEDGSFKKAKLDLTTSTFVIRIQSLAGMQKLVISNNTGQRLTELSLE